MPSIAPAACRTPCSAEEAGTYWFPGASHDHGGASHDEAERATHSYWQGMRKGEKGGTQLAENIVIRSK